MKKLQPLLLPALFIIFLSCKNEQSDNSITIKDFRKSLQPFLHSVVAKGWVTYHDSAQIKNITDEELTRLTRSENPVLRATALSEMLDRSSFNHFNIVMNHLSDTAIVVVDVGEFGAQFITVSDYILQDASWETEAAREKTIEAVLTKHNYLQSAYSILRNLKPQEKYYPYVKDIAMRTMPENSNNLNTVKFRDIEYALYGLAKFRKKEDIPAIKNKLSEHIWEISDISFRLMQEFPDTAYLDVLQTYHRQEFYHFSGNRPYGFSGFNADNASPENFIDALVVQQNERSAKLLDTILTTLPKYTCMPDRENIIRAVIMAIFKHPCPAYTILTDKIAPKAKQILKDRIIMPFVIDSVPPAPDTTKRKIHWFS